MKEETMPKTHPAASTPAASSTPCASPNPSQNRRFPSAEIQAAMETWAWSRESVANPQVCRA